MCAERNKKSDRSDRPSILSGVLFIFVSILWTMMDFKLCNDKTSTYTKSNRGEVFNSVVIIARISCKLGFLNEYYVGWIN